MSRPRYRWWGFVRRMIRDYRGLKAAYEDLHSQSITADTSGMPKGGGTGRAVEDIALRQLPKDDQEVYDAVSRAVEITELLPDGELKLALIKLMYWSEKTLTAKSAALLLHISKRTAERWHGEFVKLTAKCYGFTLRENAPNMKVGVPEPKKCATIVESK